MSPTLVAIAAGSMIGGMLAFIVFIWSLARAASKEPPPVNMATEGPDVR